MRLDKYLKVSRILKRRTVAHDAASGNRIKVNGVTAKPGHTLKINDIVVIAFANSTFTFKVLKLLPNATKQQAEEMYETIS